VPDQILRLCLHRRPPKPIRANAEIGHDQTLFIFGSDLAERATRPNAFAKDGLGKGPAQIAQGRA
jgi:hypothetical protein